MYDPFYGFPGKTELRKIHSLHIKKYEILILQFHMITENKLAQNRVEKCLLKKRTEKTKLIAVLQKLSCLTAKGLVPLH